MDTPTENNDTPAEINDTPDEESTPPPGPTRPLGYWLRVVDSHLTAAFAEAFETEGVGRREWMLLNAVDRSATDPDVTARLARRGKKLRALESRGWVEEAGDGTWSLTDSGREAKARLSAIVDGIRSRVVDAVGEEQYAATVTALESIAREFGWDGSSGPRSGSRNGRRGPRPFRPEIRYGFGPNRHKGFGPGRFPTDAPHPPHARHGHHADTDTDPRNRHDGARGYGHHWHGHAHGHGHGHGHRDDTAFERGFVAGFDAGTQRGTAA